MRNRMIGIRVSPDHEKRLVELQRQLAERNPDVRVTLSRTATIVMAKAVEAMAETKEPRE